MTKWELKGRLHGDQPPRKWPEELVCGEGDLQRCREGNSCFVKQANFWNTLIPATYTKGHTPLPSWFSLLCPECKMGLSHSKAHPRVTKVAPLQNKEEEMPAGPVDFAFSRNLEEKSTYSLARLQDRTKALQGQLPPLRETWYGRCPAGKQKAPSKICVFGTRRAIDRFTCLAP